MKPFFTCIFLLMVTLLRSQPSQVYIPTLNGESWRVCHFPNLGDITGDDETKMHIVDHSFIQDNEGKWQLWACIRGAKPGRILYKWEGESLEKPSWTDMGIAARADESWGEQTLPQELIQAPYFVKIDNKYWCFYNSIEVRVMFSDDGKNYERLKFHKGNNILTHANGFCKGRDPMIFKDDDGTWYLYTTVSYSRDGEHKAGEVIVRSSKNLRNWSDYTVVNKGGIGGSGYVSSESPFVVKYKGKYYLFRASSITFLTYVYCSDTPYNFGIDNDDKLIAILPLKAPEVFEHNGQWYISDLADFKGIKLHKMEWVSKE